MLNEYAALWPSGLIVMSLLSGGCGFESHLSHVDAVSWNCEPSHIMCENSVPKLIAP